MAQAPAEVLLNLLVRIPTSQQTVCTLTSDVIHEVVPAREAGGAGRDRDGVTG